MSRRPPRRGGGRPRCAGPRAATLIRGTPLTGRDTPTRRARPDPVNGPHSPPVTASRSAVVAACAEVLSGTSLPEYAHTSHLHVRVGGEVVVDEHLRGPLVDDVFSVTKSVLSTVLGVLAAQGLLPAPDQPARVRRAARAARHAGRDPHLAPPPDDDPGGRDRRGVGRRRDHRTARRAGGARRGHTAAAATGARLRLRQRRLPPAHGRGRPAGGATRVRLRAARAVRAAGRGGRPVGARPGRRPLRLRPPAAAGVGPGAAGPAPARRRALRRPAARRPRPPRPDEPRPVLRWPAGGPALRLPDLAGRRHGDGGLLGRAAPGRRAGRRCGRGRHRGPVVRSRATGARRAPRRLAPRPRPRPAPPPARAPATVTARGPRGTAAPRAHPGPGAAVDRSRSIRWSSGARRSGPPPVPVPAGRGP
ncbi:MAG: hypothetical protein AVDCRST_MAG66-3978 [uncultured Pseudonocardia sp.]|uniref:Beta-lactamase-related domain-containing protein n=1 Tax=uncultured Pseudonocardia sp. TaxID=211455 RepID=A0A6J4QL84_9PSEU|nr:MAG: hypothetical protein AVDCRST_MAG66-3978 [uncultured Pseudonocardia sp.]